MPRGVADYSTHPRIYSSYLLIITLIQLLISIYHTLLCKQILTYALIC